MGARRAAAFALAAVLAAGLGCASAPAPTGPPIMSYLERVKARVLVARASPTQRIRFNPVACDCPPYELELDGVWQRAAFANTDLQAPAVLSLEEAALDSQKRGTLPVWTVAGTLEDTYQTCARGALVVGFTLEVFEPPPPETPPGVSEPEPAEP